MNNEIDEDTLTVAQVQQVHQFGETWIKDYSSTSRSFWEKALWLFAWEKKVRWSKNRVVVPTGIGGGI